MAPDELIAECKDWFLDPEFARLRALRDADPPTRMMGCFPVYTPEELVAAAGLHPVHVYGAGGLVEIDHADSRMQSFVCSISRSTLELGLTRRLDFLDGMLFPSICDVSRNLSGLWQRNFPDRLTEYIHFPENPSSEHARGYLRDELAYLEGAFAGITGRRPTVEDYRRVFSIYNRQREAVAELYALRVETPWKAPLADAYAVVRAGGMMPRERHATVLDQAIQAFRASSERPRDRVRVVVEGPFCEQPPLELLLTFEQAGCYVVNDDLLLGERWFDAPLPLEGDPLDVLAGHLLARCVPSAVRHPGPSGRGEALVRKVRASGAEAVVFCMAKFCEPALYDYALLKRALDSAGIRHLAFEFEEKMGTFESVRAQLETFVESILLFS